MQWCYQMNFHGYTEKGGLDPISPWSEYMAPASGTILKYDLPPRNGRPRSIALEIEKGSRSYRFRAKDYSRDKPVVAKSLGIKCPEDVYTEEAAKKFLMEHQSAWLLFEGFKEMMMEGHWQAELRQTKISEGISAAKRQFPHGSLGGVLQWYLRTPEVGAVGQKNQFAANAREVMILTMDRHEAYAHLDSSDLTVTDVNRMYEQWQREGKSIQTFRQALVLLSSALNHACDRPEITGAARGPGFGTMEREGKSNPFNTKRREIDRAIAKQRADDDSKGPDPFNHDEARAIITVFRKSTELRPYWPLVGMLFATGARPNEILALPWRNVLGLWNGYTNRSTEFLWDDDDRQLHGGPCYLSVAVSKWDRNHHFRTMRFKSTKNQNKRRPKLNHYIPGYKDLFQKAIEARLPADLRITNTPDWRDQLVFQGPRQGAEDDPFMPYDWHNFRRYWKQGLELADVRYRNAYQMRHTYVSLMRYEGHSDANIAQWIGDTVQTMGAKYAGCVMSSNLDID